MTATTDAARAERAAALRQHLRDRVLVLDGAMGTSIQALGLTEHDCRNKSLAAHEVAPAGNNDLLSLTSPDLIADIHRSFAAAGADLISTNTFNSNSISQADYKLEALAHDLNLHGAPDGSSGSWARRARPAASVRTSTTPLPETSPSTTSATHTPKHLTASWPAAPTPS